MVALINISVSLSPVGRLHDEGRVLACRHGRSRHWQLRLRRWCELRRADPRPPRCDAQAISALFPAYGLIYTPPT